MVAHHDVGRSRLVAADAEAVLAAMGVAVEREDLFLSPGERDLSPERVAFVRGRVCVGSERDAEILRFLTDREVEDHQVVALWWPGTAA